MSFQANLKGRLEEVGETVGDLRRWARAEGLPDAVARKLSIAADELLNNIVSYGIEAPGAHDIRMEVEVRADTVRLELSDDGMPFDPLSLETPDTEEASERRKIGGLGIHLVRRVMDEVTYQRIDGRNQLILKLFDSGIDLRQPGKATN